LKSTKSDYVYYTRKNKKKVDRKLEFTKYDPKVRERVTFKEAKK
jgi:ribosomal protein L33